jgi:hypothetical protein
MPTYSTKEFYMSSRKETFESSAPEVTTPDSRRKASSPEMQPRADLNRVQRIQDAAYRRAQERGFAPGAELDDWLAAERQIDEELNPGRAEQSSGT